MSDTLRVPYADDDQPVAVGWVIPGKYGESGAISGIVGGGQQGRRWLADGTRCLLFAGIAVLLVSNGCVSGWFPLLDASRRFRSAIGGLR
jgi:hypothetical protein